MSKAEALAREFLDAARFWRQRAGDHPDDSHRRCASAFERLAEHARGLPEFDHRVAALAYLGPAGDGAADFGAGGQGRRTTLQRITTQDGLHDRHPSEPDDFLSFLYDEYLSQGKRDAEMYASLGDA